MSEQQSSFEKEINEAKELLSKLSSPDITLSDSVKLYKDGMQKLKNANELLEKAKLEFEEVDGEAAPF